jgi:hypothetical protein
LRQGVHLPIQLVKLFLSPVEYFFLTRSLFDENLIKLTFQREIQPKEKQVRPILMFFFVMNFSLLRLCKTFTLRPDF